MKRSFCMTLLALAGLLPAMAQPDQASQAALRGLQDFGGLLSAQTMGGFGFLSTNELGLMKLGGERLPIHDLSLESLRAWQPAQGASNLLADPRAMMFPVTVSNQVRTAVWIRKPGSTWRPESFGGGNLARLYVNMRATNAAVTTVSVTNHFGVRVNALQAYLIGYWQTNQFTLISLVDIPELMLTNSVPMPAEDALQRLAHGAHVTGVFPQ